MFSIQNGEKHPSLPLVMHYWTKNPASNAAIKTVSAIRNPEPVASQYLREGVVDYASGDMFVFEGFLSHIDVEQYVAMLQKKEVPHISLETALTCLNEVFGPNFEEMNMERAISSIQYMQDIENQRVATLNRVASYLLVTKYDWETVLAQDPETLEWVTDMEKYEKEIQELYGKLYVDTRIWVVFKALATEPMDKFETIAFINTLFPPYPEHLPEGAMKHILFNHRATLYQWVDIIEKKGSNEDLLLWITKHMNTSKSARSYQDMCQNIQQYFNIANAMVADASEMMEFGRIANISEREEGYPSTKPFHLAHAHVTHAVGGNAEAEETFHSAHSCFGESPGQSPVKGQMKRGPPPMPSITDESSTDRFSFLSDEMSQSAYSKSSECGGLLSTSLNLPVRKGHRISFQNLPHRDDKSKVELRKQASLWSLKDKLQQVTSTVPPSTLTHSATLSSLSTYNDNESRISGDDALLPRSRPFATNRTATASTSNLREQKRLASAAKKAELMYKKAQEAQEKLGEMRGKQARKEEINAALTAEGQMFLMEAQLRDARNEREDGKKTLRGWKGFLGAMRMA